MDNIIFKQAVEKFQCPGCVNGSDTQCGAFEEQSYSKACKNHCAGTMALGAGMFYLGMPKGFDKVGFAISADLKNNIRIFSPDKLDGLYDLFNVPVWYQEIEGNLFVRCFIPRRNTAYIDIILGGKAEDIQIKSLGTTIGEVETDLSQFKPINVGDFADRID